MLICLIKLKAAHIKSKAFHMKMNAFFIENSRFSFQNASFSYQQTHKRQAFSCHVNSQIGCCAFSLMIALQSAYTHVCGHSLSHELHWQKTLYFTIQNNSWISWANMAKNTVFYSIKQQLNHRTVQFCIKQVAKM